MTAEQLQQQRDDICFKMIEAEGKELSQLQQELSWVEELLKEQGVTDEEE